MGLQDWCRGKEQGWWNSRGLTSLALQGVPSGWLIHTIHLTGTRQDEEGQA